MEQNTLLSTLLLRTPFSCLSSALSGFCLLSSCCLVFASPCSHFFLQSTHQASACICMSMQRIPSRPLLTCVCLLLLSLRLLSSSSSLDNQSGVSCCSQALRSLVSNEAVQLEPYLHQIMPFILTCMVGKRLGVSFMGGFMISEQHLNTIAV